MAKYAVTGLGLISPLGIGKFKSWQALINGQSQVKYEIKNEAFLARVSGFDMPEELKQTAMAFLAAQEAVFDADLTKSNYPQERIGLAAGESKINLYNKEFFYDHTLPAQLKKTLDIKGITRSFSAACATGTVNIIQGCKMIENDLCDAVICGSAETSIHPLYISSFKNMGVLSKQGVRPFDSQRDGFAIGEGAGFIVVEDMKKALIRGAKIYCEISGFSNGIFTDDILKIESADKMSNIIKKAAGNDVPDYIHMHGTGTKLNDYFESLAIKESFENAQEISLSSTKGATGHMLGVSGMTGAIVAILAMKENMVPPTINFKESDINFGLNYTPNQAQKKIVNSALSLSFGFGGQGAALYFKKTW